MNIAYKKKFKRRLITLIILVVVFITLILLRLSKDVCEWWFRTIGRAYYYVFAPLTKYIPFSLTEIAILVAIASLIIWLFLTIRHIHRLRFKGSSKWWLGIANVALIFGIAYFTSCGMSYNRYPVDIPQYEGDPIEDEQMYYDMGYYFLTDFNNATAQLEFEESGEVKNPYSTYRINEILNEEYSKLESDYFHKFTTNAKPMYLLSWLYREFQITGITFCPLGEANVNNLATNAEKPFTMAHELAHSKGVMKEDEANLVAAYICINSSDAFLKYSGYMRCFNSAVPFIRASNFEGAYQNYQKTINKNIGRNKTYIYDYWDKHNLLENMSDFFNNIYLEIFGNQTTDSYIDHTHTDVIIKPDGTKKYKISSYSPYQKMMIATYLKSVAK